MLTILGQLVPIFIYFLIGVLIRQARIAERAHGDFLLRFAFFVTLPLLILTSVSSLDFTADRAVLPLLCIGVNIVCLAASYVVIRLRGLDRRKAGTIIVNTTIVNNAFMFPFILAVYGQSGFADAVLFDFGNAIMMASFVYAMAFRYSDVQHERWTMLLRILKSPLVWCLVLSVVLALTHTRLPGPVLAVVSPLAQMTAPLILVALGIFSSLKLAEPLLTLRTIGIRMGVGLLGGLALATLAGLSGVTFTVVVLCSGAPIGFNALTYTSLANLDTDLSASAVSLSILCGLVYTPALILLFNFLG